MSTSYPLIIRRSAVWAVGSVAALTLMGCSVDPIGDAFEKGAEKAAEKAVEKASGGDVDIDADGGKVTIKGEDGESLEINTGDGAEVPDSFPSELPLPDGRLLSSMAIDEGFSLQYFVEGKDASAALVDELKGAGFTEEQTADMGEMTMSILQDGNYSVTVSFMEDDEDPVLSYIVAPMDAE